MIAKYSPSLTNCPVARLRGGSSRYTCDKNEVEEGDRESSVKSDSDVKLSRDLRILITGVFVFGAAADESSIFGVDVILEGTVRMLRKNLNT